MSLWTRPHWLLGAGIFAAYVNYTVLLPVVPLFITELGHSEFAAGIVLASFSLFSFIFRPHIGRLIDSRGSRWGLVAGDGLLAIGTLVLAWPIIWLMVVANTIRGLAWGSINTAGNAMLAELAPPNRRGEAAGNYTFFQGLAAVLGPPAALWIVNVGSETSFYWVFGLATGIGLAGGGMAALLPGEKASTDGTSAPHFPDEARELVPRAALLPSGMLASIMVTQPAVLAFVPLYIATLDVSSANATLFYLANGIATLSARLLIGRLGDRFTRRFALNAGVAPMFAALLMLPLARSPVALLTAAALYGAGLGTVLPALTAFAIDRASRDQLGAHMATFSAAFQVGIGVGSVAMGAMIEHSSYTTGFLSMAVPLGFVMAFSGKVSNDK